MSWIDAILEGIRRLPFPEWIFYPALAVVEAVLLHFATWSSGELARGEWSVLHLLLAFWTVFPLAFVDHLDRVAARAVQTIRPALTGGDRELARLRTALTTMPAGTAALAGAAGVAILWMARFSAPVLFQTALTSAAASVLWLTLASLNFALVSCAVYHTIRQLVLVSRIHAGIAEINLFRLEPLYAFSLLCAQTGAGWVLALYLSILGFPQLLRSAVSAGLVAMILLLALATFFLPLWGVHVRIRQAKETLLAEAGQRSQAAVLDMYRKLDLGDDAAVSQLATPTATLLTIRNEVAHLPTWPWGPGTLTGFLSALLLPLVIWGIQQVLAGLIGV
jgi:hypothetical protein